MISPISATSVWSGPSTAMTAPRLCSPGCAVNGGEILERTLILLIYGIAVIEGSMFLELLEYVEELDVLESDLGGMVW